MDGLRTQDAHPIRTFKHSLSILVTFSLRLKSYFWNFLLFMLYIDLRSC